MPGTLDLQKMHATQVVTELLAVLPSIEMHCFVTSQ